MTNYPYNIAKTNTITDDKLLVKYVAAFLYGDGCVTRRNTNNGKYKSAQVVDNRDFIDWKADVLSNITHVRMSLREKHIKYPNQRDQIVTETGNHPFYTKFRERLYIDGVKRIDPHYLKLLDWESLAIFYQDDGTMWMDRKTKPSGKSYSYPRIKICSNGYSYADHLLFQRAVKDKFDIELNIRRSFSNGNIQWFFAIPQRFIMKFISGVKPFIFPSFYYKVCESDGKLHGDMDGEIVRTSTNIEVEDETEMISY